LFEQSVQDLAKMQFESMLKFQIHVGQILTSSQSGLSWAMLIKYCLDQLGAQLS